MNTYQADVANGINNPVGKNSKMVFNDVFNGAFNIYDDEDATIELSFNRGTFLGALYEIYVDKTFITGAGSAVKFDMVFEKGTTANRYDMQYPAGLYVECKNYGETSAKSFAYKSQFVNQFVAYITQIEKMADLQYYFKKRTANIPSLTVLKEQFQKLYQAPDYAIFDTFWNNAGLRGDIWNDLIGVSNPTPIVKSQKFLDFQNKVLSTNSLLYNFIEVK